MYIHAPNLSTDPKIMRKGERTRIFVVFICKVTETHAIFDEEVLKFQNNIYINLPCFTNNIC